MENPNSVDGLDLGERYKMKNFHSRYIIGQLVYVNMIVLLFRWFSFFVSIKCKALNNYLNFIRRKT